MRAMLSFVFGIVLAATAAGQSQFVLVEDFETGAPGWSAAGTPSVLWHIAPDGQCGAVTAMAAYNRAPAACDYDTGGFNAGTMQSPAFTLTGALPFTLEHDFIRMTDTGDDLTIGFVDVGTGNHSEILIPPVTALSPSHLSLAIPDFFAGKTIRVEFKQLSNAAGNLGVGWMVDNVRVHSNAFEDLGFAKPAFNGPPHLTGNGTLEPGSSNWLMLTGVPASAPAMLVFGLSQLNAPFKGGTLVPTPTLVVPLAANAFGFLFQAFTWSSGVPAGVSLYFQFWVQDPSATLGLSASNGMKGVTS